MVFGESGLQGFAMEHYKGISWLLAGHPGGRLSLNLRVELNAACCSGLTMLSAYSWEALALKL